MRELIGCSVSRQHIEHWSALLVVEAAPYFVPETLCPLLPHDLPVFSRQDLAALRLDLAVDDSYTFYAVAPAYQHVVFLRDDDVLALAPALRQALLAAQVSAGRGQVYDWEQVAEYFTSVSQADRYCVETEQGRKLILEYALWHQLPRATQEHWLRSWIAHNSHPYATIPLERLEARHALPAGLLRLANTFALTSGPNCFATTLAALTTQPSLALTISNLWLHQNLFLQGLHTRGYVHGHADLSPGVADAVCLWQDARGIARHACWIIGDGLALNKNSQAWYTSRHIATLSDIRDYWQEDHFAVMLYTRR